MDAILASAFGALVGLLIVAGFFWWSVKKRPHWYAKSAVKDTALTLTVVALSFAVFSVPVGQTYFVRWMFYSIAISLTSYGYYQAFLARRAKKAEEK